MSASRGKSRRPGARAIAPKVGRTSRSVLSLPSGAVAVDVWKLSGAGNDFAALDNRRGVLPPEGPKRDVLIHALCGRAAGLGTDGALILELPSKAGGAGDAPGGEAAHVRMRYHNRDGGESEMCGNGARCLALFAWRLGAAPNMGMRIETRAGIQKADVISDRPAESSIRLAMPDVAPGWNTGPISVEGWRGQADFLSTGVPHAVVWIGAPEKLESLDVERVGVALRHHETFAPSGTNVNFACGPTEAGEGGAGKPLGRGRGAAAARKSYALILLRTYERGVEAETLACGTGSVATAICAARLGRAHPPMRVRVRSGAELIINFRLMPDGTAREVTLQGPARMIFRAKTLWNSRTGLLFAMP